MHPEVSLMVTALTRSPVGCSAQTTKQSKSMPGLQGQTAVMNYILSLLL